MWNIYSLNSKAQLNKDVNSQVNADSIAYVLLKIFVCSSHESKSYDVTRLRKRVDTNI